MLDPIFTQFLPGPCAAFVRAHHRDQAVIAGKARVHAGDHHGDIGQLMSHGFFQNRGPVAQAGRTDMHPGRIFGAVAFDEIEELTARRFDA